MKISKIYGFISYSHSDGTDLTEGLDNYLKGHSPNFESIYDGDVPEGEKLEKILEKLSLCSVLIVVITTASLESEAVTEEINLAKKKGMKIIPCKNKYVERDWDELPWDIQEFKGIDFENMYELRRKVVFSLGRILKELEKSDDIEEMTDKEEYEQQLALAEEEEAYRLKEDELLQKELDEAQMQESVDLAELETELESQETSEQEQMAEQEDTEQESLEYADVVQEVQDQKAINEPIIQTDKSVYLYNTDMILTIITKSSEDNSPINIKILSEEKDLVYKKTIPITDKNQEVYQEVIRLSGEDWLRKPGSEYTIIAERGGNSSQLVFFLSSFGISVELDKIVYTWTDKVYITIIAPDLVTDSNKINTIGDKPNALVTISTRNSKIAGYKLVETGKGTGVFTGEITLTGFSGHDVKGDKGFNSARGITKGKGPTDGLLSCRDDDGLTVTLTTPHIAANGSALIRWNIGEIEWQKSEYKINESATIIVIDPDMNLNPDQIDIFNIRIWSNSDPVGIELPVVETGNATGIFMGVVSLTSKPSGKGNIMVTENDGITAEYVDRTLPSPYSLGQTLKITTYAKIT